MQTDNGELTMGKKGRKVTFVLPPNIDQPAGGYKIVFQYANYLVDKGYEVEIYFTFLPESKSRVGRIGQVFGRKVAAGIGYRYKNSISWFNLMPRVDIKFGATPWQISTGTFDVLIATSWKTAKLVSEADAKKKCYLIQDWETFGRYSDQEVEETWRMGLTNIVVASWLKDKGNSLGVPTTLIRNSIDSSVFDSKAEFSDRGHSLSMLCHVSKNKASDWGLTVIHELKKKYPDLRVELFGAPTCPDDLPDYITYHRLATANELKNEVYGKTSVYMMTSDWEGWGLTGMEAMASGSAFVTTDNGGIDEYIFNNVNGIIVPIRDTEKMVKAVSRIFDDLDLRRRFVLNGYDSLKNFSIDVSGQQLVEIIGG